VRDVRKGQNEAWFRELNERLEDRATTGEGRVFDVVCECSRAECADRIAMSLADYEAVRANARTFVLLSAHVDPSCERVVSTTDGYVVVEKFGDAALVAEVQNPRSGDMWTEAAE
jgi:hypothetical protein